MVRTYPLKMQVFIVTEDNQPYSGLLFQSSSRKCTYRKSRNRKRLIINRYINLTSLFYFSDICYLTYFLSHLLQQKQLKDLKASGSSKKQAVRCVVCYVQCFIQGNDNNILQLYHLCSEFLIHFTRVNAMLQLRRYHLTAVNKHTCLTLVGFLLFN